ncbi:MAG: Helicase associated domain protein [Lachnospiraceae bacterium]|nr:Helicase associated domain protein [Lachnospiraceae bacterium]
MTLFEHNSTAYEAALALMKKTGKAAVIHPTGTGKSFIAFHLCEQHPESLVCWLSPSEYIFQTQKENWLSAGGSVPENIRFITYAKLMLMNREELSEIKPDYIILDEFHRCGARMWGQGVQILLRMYPAVPVLGLSATNVRYLDNRRDMAKELFDRNIASEMTLGEALMRGILNPPKYVLSVFSYQKDLERYEARIRSAKNKAVREEAGACLEALRRALEKADGLDEIFRKHIPDRTGKYIVFCANFEHMQEMMKKTAEWFAGMDTEPHMYPVYSEDPETSRAFAQFRADESEHLKFLFCIDMLNEGIHVDGVNGVILLRPTISPIIYKQQIGRALSANGKKEAVIFDIVLNIENLYSVGVIEEEMQTAMMYYRRLGKDGEIVNEHFRIIDEVRDCMRLFNSLNETLNASWNLMYEAARRYYGEHGNLEVPKRHVTEEGLSLGAWVATQRRVYANKENGILTKEQIEKLDAIEMRWQGAKDLVWEKNFAAAKKYYREHGNLLVNINEDTSDNTDNVALGKWIARLRAYKKSGNRCVYLSPERIAALEKIGMIWDVPDYCWERHYRAALSYYRNHGNLDIAHDYVDENGVRLGAWVSKMRMARRNTNYRGAALTKEQIAKLDELGMAWGSKQDAAWEKSYEEACRYQKEYGNLDIPAAYVTENGCRLGKWLRHQREAYKTGLPEERKKKLDALGMVWEPKDPWESKFDLAKRYYEEHGSLDMKSNCIVEGVWLARWLSEQSARMNQTEKSAGESGAKAAKTLTPVQVKKLESLGLRPYQAAL